MLLVVCVVSLSIRLWLLDKRWINPDEGPHLMDAVLVLDGKIPRVDFDSRELDLRLQHCRVPETVWHELCLGASPADDMLVAGWDRGLSSGHRRSSIAKLGFCRRSRTGCCHWK